MDVPFISPYIDRVPLMSRMGRSNPHFSSNIDHCALAFSLTHWLLHFAGDAARPDTQLAMPVANPT